MEIKTSPNREWDSIVFIVSVTVVTTKKKQSFEKESDDPTAVSEVQYNV